jgi:outer membrane protein assembly factor BamB
MLSVAYGGVPAPPTTAGAVTPVSELPPSSELAGPVPQYRLEPRHRGISPQGTKVDSTLSFSWKTEPLNIGSYPASRSSPAVDETAIYIGADDGQLYALNREDGSTLWTFKTRRYEVEMAKKAKRERKAKRAKKTKKVKKAKRARDYENHGIHGTPAFDHEYVYIGDYSGWIYALDKKLDG